MIDKIFDLFGIEEVEEEEEEVVETSKSGRRVVPFTPNKKEINPERRQNNRRQEMESNIIIQKPVRLEDAQEIIDQLMDGNSVAINLEKADGQMKQRIMDMIAGYCYCVSCNIEKVSGDIFIVSGHEIQNDNME